MMRARWILLAIVAYALFMVATLPASVALSLLEKYGVSSAGSSGSIWHGQLRTLKAGVVNIGDVEWQVRFLPVFTGKLAADLKVTQTQGYAQARVLLGITGTLTLQNVAASLPLQTLLGNGGLPGGWVGTAQLQLDSLVLKNQWPVAAQGTINIIDLTGPARAPANIGSYRLTLPAAGSDDAKLIASLSDMDGAAIATSGSLTLNKDRSYLFEVLVAARANAPADIVKGMEFLGSPDAQGRRPFSLSGSF